MIVGQAVKVAEASGYQCFLVDIFKQFCCIKFKISLFVKHYLTTYKNISHQFKGRKKKKRSF